MLQTFDTSTLSVEYTAQDFFDLAVSTLLEQGKPSYSETLERCAYRGANGAKCALGVWLPEQHAKNADLWAATGRVLAKWRWLPEPSDWGEARFAVPGAIWPDFLEELQSCHDGSRRFTDPSGTDREYFLREFTTSVRWFAKRWKLDTRVLDQE